MYLFCPSEKVEINQNKLLDQVEYFFPLKTVKLSGQDKPYLTQELKQIDRKIKREYCKHGKSNKYIQFKEVYDEKLKKASAAFINKNVKSLN